MRLIDVDKLKRMYAQSDKAQLPCIVDGREIDKAPTVEAIPIEYIEKFKKKVRHIAPAKEAIDWLLEEWGKENADTD